MFTPSLHPPAPLAASPGPWSACAGSFASGAVYINDANGELIGFATDFAGHTTEHAPPDRRTPAEQLRNGYRMALAPQMLDVLGAIVINAPAVLRAIAASGGQTHGAFLYAVKRAKAILAADAASALLAPQHAVASRMEKGTAA